MTIVFEPDWMVISAVCIGKAFNGLRRALVLTMCTCTTPHFLILILVYGRVNPNKQGNIYSPAYV